MTVSPSPASSGNASDAAGIPADPAAALAPAAVWSAAGLGTVEHGAAGRFDGAALFLDVSGFTTLSEGLARLGSAGTEELVRSLNAFFEPAIALVRRSGGEVVAFGGDAITAVWGGADAFARALACAERIAERSRERGTLATSAGDFTIAVRIGVAGGEVDVTIGGTGDRLVVVTGGPAVDGAVTAEEAAGLNEVEARPLDDQMAGHAKPRTATAAPNASWEPSRFAHPVIVDRIRRGDTTLIDGHRRVTTVFAHIVHPGRLADAIRSIVAIVDGLDGELIQVTGGDKGTVAMLTFGAPTSSPEDARRAVAAGMRLTDELPGVSVGIGTGTVFAGLVGGPVRSVYTVIGDAVNLAARLMQRAEPGAVLVDGSSAEAARVTFEFEDQGSLTVKGKRDEVEVSRLVGQRRRLWPTNRLSTDGPLVGRAAQLEAAEQALDPGQDRIRRVLIEGPPGIGKSRLLRAIAERAAARGWRVLAGGAADLGGSAPYAPWQPILRAIVDVDDPSRVVTRLVPDAADLVPLLGPLLGVPLDATPATASLEGEVRSELADELAVRLLIASARQRPVLLQLEDWQWADPSSVRLLDRLLAREDRAAIAVIVTRRTPSPGPAVSPRGGDVRIELTELDARATRELAASAGAKTGAGLDEAGVDRIVELAGGNPLMVETLIEVGGEEMLATGLAGLLQARLDRFADDDLRSLLWASAFRRPLAADELRAAMAEGGEPDEELPERLDRLVADGVLRTATTPTLAFRHASIREAAYERLSHESRRRVHHGVAVALEDRDGLAIEIASHLVLTDDVGRQRRWFPRAGDQARQAWAVDEAISWLDRALDLGEAPDDVRIDLSELLMVRGDLPRVAELIDEPVPDPSIERRRLIVAGERSMITGDNERAVDTLAEAVAVSEGSAPPTQACAAGELLSRALLEAGRVDDALETARDVARGVAPDDHDTMARAIGAYGVVQIMLYDLAGAISTLGQAIAEAEAGRDRVRLIHLRSDLAAAYAMSGDASAALEQMLAARAVAEEIGYRRHLALSVSNEAQLRLDLGQGEAALALSMRGLREAAALGDVGLACDNLLRLADDPVLSIEDRRTIWDRSMHLESGLGRPHTKVEFDVVAIEISADETRSADPAQAQRVLADARSLGRPDLELRVLTTLGAQADRNDLADLASRSDEPGDRFLIDVATRRRSGDPSVDVELLERGLSLYRTTPFESYRRALAELGEPRPFTDAVLPPWEPTPEDPPFTVDAVLDTVDRLVQERSDH